ncbi:Co2+/Mg2+ efflux protein ApaG [Salinimonas sp. HHU 13199]|uniref:Protein ApaG n=1 Tax=Salinimonas profundi TaxID=2729140 RepID=A0ABR8LLT0_9ALTE|nr:Co2+/Mg2+ efflux protein ApaG [Salinimonas profundi]MBD3585896.1 Co2+/Mg2+ efflux protein ApaG [Salinimonas profundi]
MNESLIKVDVSTRHLPDHPANTDEKYAFAYQIVITNESDIPVQLISRYWLITDGSGKKSEVQGDGVIGKQPKIAPGGNFEYTSGAVIDTPVGTMEGYYQMQTEDGDMFKVPIDVFTLAVPNIIN